MQTKKLTKMKKYAVTFTNDFSMITFIIDAETRESAIRKALGLKPEMTFWSITATTIIEP